MKKIERNVYYLLDILEDIKTKRLKSNDDVIIKLIIKLYGNNDSNTFIKNNKEHILYELIISYKVYEILSLKNTKIISIEKNFIEKKIIISCEKN